MSEKISDIKYRYANIKYRYAGKNMPEIYGLRNRC